MDEFDAPRKVPVEVYDRVPDLSELQRQTCQLFEEFLLLEDSEFKILDEPSSASNSLKIQQEEADSPIEFCKQKALPRSRGLKFNSGQRLESLDDDVVPDSIPSQASDDVVPDSERSFPVGLASRAPVEQDENEESQKKKMKNLALELAKAGDALVSEHGSNVKDVEGKLVQLVKQEAASLTYERFSTAIDDLVGKDKNWTNFVFATYIGKRLCRHSVGTLNYFQQYILSYCETMRESGDLETFILQRSPMSQ